MSEAAAFREVDCYDVGYYDEQAGPSLVSARILLAYLWEFFQPKSVTDVGCGRGAWLKACRELGSDKLVGLDGKWISQSLMMDDNILFKSVDLNKLPSMFDAKAELAMCVEVAEHLEPNSSSQLVKFLTECSETILFGAAYTKQGGTAHVNERPHTFWCALFEKLGYVPFDLFRPVFWGNGEVCFWYRQNTFLYVKEDSTAHAKLKALGCKPIESVSFMNCIHPELYHAHLAQKPNFRSHLSDLFPSFMRSLKRRVNGK